MVHRTTDELAAAVPYFRGAPADVGRVELIVRRPRLGTREVLDVGELTLEEGLAGDTWIKRGSKRTTDGSAHPDMQLNVMSARAIEVIAADRERWPLAGDQLYLDLDISHDNLPAGSQLTLGGAVIEVTAIPHTGCHKFVARFGKEAMRFVNSAVGSSLRLRGLNARVVTPGTVYTGDKVVVSRPG
jgi:MOSC domain-containing protein YiiM